jgi:hypothetical protein
VSEVVLVKQERHDLFNFEARSRSQIIETVALEILTVITQFIAFMAVYKDGNFSQCRYPN